MLGVPDLYCHRGWQALDVCTDHSGAVTCVLSSKSPASSDDSDSKENHVMKKPHADINVYCVSIWLNLYGMVRVGEIFIDIPKTAPSQVQVLPDMQSIEPTESESTPSKNSKKEKLLQGADLILWHPRGKRLCIVAQGRLHIVTLIWQDILHAQPALLASAFVMSAVDSDAPPTCPVKVALTIVSQMPAKFVVNSVTLAAGKQVFYGILHDGKIAKLSWHGICQGYVVLPISNIPVPASAAPLSPVLVHFQPVVLSTADVYEQEQDDDGGDDSDYKSPHKQKQARDKEQSSEDDVISGRMPVSDGLEDTSEKAAAFIGFSSRLRTSIFITSDGALSFICAETRGNGQGLATSSQLHLTVMKQSARVLLNSCLVETDEETFVICMVQPVGGGDRNNPNNDNNQQITMIAYQLERSGSSIQDSTQFVSVQMFFRSSVELQVQPSEALQDKGRGKSNDGRPILIPSIQYGQPCIFVLHLGQISCHVCSQLNSSPLFRCPVPPARGACLAVDKLVLWYNNEKGAVLLATPLIISIAAGGRACARSGSLYAVDTMHGTLLKYEPAHPGVTLEVSNAKADMGSDTYSDPIASTGVWSALALPRALRSQIFTNGMHEPANANKAAVEGKVGTAAEISFFFEVFSGRYMGRPGVEIVCDHSDHTSCSAGARPGLFGAGYVATACTAPAITSINADTGAVVWVYGERTLKWRSSSFVIDKNSNAEAFIFKPAPQSAEAVVPQVQVIPELQRLPAINVIYGPLVRIFAMRWIGDHTLILLTTRYRALDNRKDIKYGNKSSLSGSTTDGTGTGHTYARCVEVMSRAVTTTSLRRGEPQPEMHYVVVLPPESHSTKPLLDVLPSNMQRPIEQIVHVLVNDGVSGNRLLALELIVKQSVSFASSSSGIADVSAARGVAIDIPHCYLLRALWTMLPPPGRGFDKAALLRCKDTKTSINAKINAKINANINASAGTGSGIGLSAVLLDKSGIVHIARAPSWSKVAGTDADADADAGGTDDGASAWQAFADAMIDMCVVDQKHFISEQYVAQDSSAPHSNANNNGDSSASFFPHISVNPLLGEADSPTALIMSLKSNSKSLFQNNNSVIWLPLAGYADIPHALQQSHGGLILQLPSSSVGHALQPLGMCMHQGILLNCNQKGSLNPFLNSASMSGSGRSEYGHRKSFARAVIAGLPAGMLNVTATPLAATILLLLARCRTTSAVALGKSVLRALYRNPSSIAATADALEESLLELLRRKESRRSNGKLQQLPDRPSNGDNISRHNNSSSSDSAATSQAIVGRCGPEIDAESPTVAAIMAIASWPERFFGLVTNKPAVPTSSYSASIPAITTNSRINDGGFQVQIDPLAGLTYAVMLQFTFAVDPLLFFELTSHLGRKVEPETAKGLLPLALQSPYGPAILRSPLSLFEECLQQGLLTYASRYLTLACEYVGGSSSFHSSLECLSMAQELVMALLLRLRFPLAIECLEFCDRLETIIELLVTDESRKRHARKSARERDRDPSSSASSKNGSGTSTAVVNGNLNTASEPLGERIYRHWLRVSPALSHYLGGGVLWSAFSELDEQLHAERVRGNSTSISNTSSVININAPNNAGRSAQSTSIGCGSGSTSKYAVFLAVKAYLGPARFDEILSLSLKSEARYPACEGVSFSSALIAMFCDQLLAAKKTYMCGLTVLALLSSEKIRRQIHGHLLGRNRFNTASTSTSTSNMSVVGSADAGWVLASARRLLQLGKIDGKEYNLISSREERESGANSADTDLEARLAVLRMEGEQELYAFESPALVFALYILQSYGFIPSRDDHAARSPKGVQKSNSSPKIKLESTMGYVFLKQRCGFEANAGVRAQNTNHFHEMGLPEGCFMSGCSEISYSQILRGIILACVTSNKLGTAAILACVAGLPFTAAAIAELDIETTTVAYALPVVRTVLVDTPSHALRHSLCTIDTVLLDNAQNAASADGATVSQTTNLKMLCIGLGLRDVCLKVGSTNDIAYAAYTYFAEHCKHLVV